MNRAKMKNTSRDSIKEMIEPVPYHKVTKKTHNGSPILNCSAAYNERFLEQWQMKLLPKMKKMAVLAYDEWILEQ